MLLVFWELLRILIFLVQLVCTLCIISYYIALYIILQSFVIVLALCSSKAFSTSVDISSYPVAVPLFIESMAFCTSSYNVLFPVLIESCGISVLLSSYNSVIYSFHLLAMSSSSNRRFPALSKICPFAILRFPVHPVSYFPFPLKH